jgi:cytochrome c553
MVSKTQSRPGAVHGVRSPRVERPERVSAPRRATPDYTIKQLKDFKAKKRTNDGGITSGLVQALSEEDIVDLAHYIGSLQ